MSNMSSRPARRIARWGLYIVFAAAMGFQVIAQPAPRVYAQSPTPSDDDVNRIAHQLYCPVCENTPLDVCPTEACRQWRDLIRQQLSEGWSESRIKQYFVDQYGARVLAEPPATGLNWLVYVLPPIIIAAGAFLLLRALSSWTRHGCAGTDGSAAQGKEGAQPDAATDAYVARLEDELKKLK